MSQVSIISSNAFHKLVNKFQAKDNVAETEIAKVTNCLIT